MRKNITIGIAAIMLALTPAHTQAQFLKNLGKALEKVAEKVVEVNETKTTETGTTTNTTTTTKAEEAEKPQAPVPKKVHSTEQTKTITLRDGAQWLGPFGCNRALVHWRGGWFAINEKGEKVFDLPDGFRPAGVRGNDNPNDGIIPVFNSNRLMVEEDSKEKTFHVHASILDLDGNEIKRFDNANSCTGFVDGAAIVEMDGTPCFVDTVGNVLTKEIYTPKSFLSGYEMYRLKENRRLYREQTDKTWGYVDEKFNIAIGSYFKKAGNFFNGRAQAQNTDGLWGFIDTEGNWVIDPIYSKTPGAFYCSYALVRDKQGVAYFINKSGDIIWTDPQPGKTGIREFLPSGYAVWTQGRNYYIMNEKFEKVADLGGLDSSGKILSSNDRWMHWYESFLGKGRLYDYKGNVLLEFECGGKTFHEGICHYQNYYFNEDGEIIVRFEDTKF